MNNDWMVCQRDSLSQPTILSPTISILLRPNWELVIIVQLLDWTNTFEFMQPDTKACTLTASTQEQSIFTQCHHRTCQLQGRHMNYNPQNSRKTIIHHLWWILYSYIKGLERPQMQVRGARVSIALGNKYWLETSFCNHHLLHSQDQIEKAQETRNCFHNYSTSSNQGNQKDHTSSSLYHQGRLRFE